MTISKAAGGVIILSHLSLFASSLPSLSVLPPSIRICASLSSGRAVT